MKKCDYPECPGRDDSVAMHELETGPEYHSDCVFALVNEPSDDSLIGKN